MSNFMVEQILLFVCRPFENVGTCERLLRAYVPLRFSIERERVYI